MVKRRIRRYASIAVAAALGATLAGWIANAAADSRAPPTTSKELFDWLRTGGYKSWARETDPRPSRGSHPGGVLTYLNPALDASLKAASATHPEGAATVLELYGKQGAVHGWAVSVKTQRDSAGGKGWYWYEVLSTEDGSRTLAADAGAASCVECHAQGRDFVLTPFPLK